MKTNAFVIEVTDRHEELNPFYAFNGLEVTEDEPVSTDTIKSWVISASKEPAAGESNDSGVNADEASNNVNTVEEGSYGFTMLGACTLAFRQGEYIIDGIAVSDALRGSGAGTALLREAEKEVKARGGSRIYLVARAPEFFRANGYETIERRSAPEFFECFGCEQYNHSCFPEVMLHVL